MMGNKNKPPGFDGVMIYDIIPFQINAWAYITTIRNPNKSD
jgi:hypothetical protein